MQAHKIQVVIPENHQLVVPIPETVRSGPAELILLVPAAGAVEETRKAEPEALAQDPGPEIVELRGLWSETPAITEEDIAEARQEMWGNFGDREI